MTAEDRFRFRQVRWPFFLAGLLFAVACAMLARAASMRGETSSILARIQSAPAAPDVQAASQRGASASLGSVPSERMRRDDLRTLYRIAGDKKTSFGLVESRSEARTAARLRIEHVAIQMDDDYSKVKAVLAAILEGFPHAYLEELELQRGADGRTRASTRLAFVYAAEAVK